VWLNRGKESVVADLTTAEDRALLEALIAKADVLLQNLKPGALAKLGYPIGDLRRRYPRLICCSISGYGDDGPYRDRKAYDLLIQAESGLASITGGPEAPARVGVSVVDIATGMHAYEAILEALIVRGRTGEGTDIRVSMFDAIMEWMAIPMLYTEHGVPPKRVGLTHPTVAPYGVFASADGVPILISVQNDREWAGLCRLVLQRHELISDPRFATNPARAANRAETDGLVAAHFGALAVSDLERQLSAAAIAFARVNSVEDILRHPHLRRVTIASPWGDILMPAAPARHAGAPTEPYGPLPALGEHTEQVRQEFLVR
jgi:formyl-CoA transferase